MTISDNTIAAEALADFFIILGGKTDEQLNTWPRMFLKTLEYLWRMRQTLVMQYF